MATATKTVQNGAAATDAAVAAVAPVTETVVSALSRTSMVAGDIVTRTAEALAPIIQSTAGKAQELTDDLGATVKKVAVMSVDAYHQVIKQQLDFSIELADAMKVDWLSELTRRNADAIGGLMAVSANAAHDMLNWSAGRQRHEGQTEDSRLPIRVCSKAFPTGYRETSARHLDASTTSTPQHQPVRLAQ